MNLRRSLWQIHRWTGLAAGVLFFVVAITGVVLIWAQELNLRGHLPLAPGSARAVSPAVPAALADFVDAHPGNQLGAVMLPPADSPRAWQVFLRPEAGGPRLVVEFDPGRATVLAAHPSGSSWQRWMEDLHYKFLLGRPGLYLCLLVSVAYILLPLTGLYVYRGVWRELLRWRPGRTPRTRTAWLHRWFGAWTILLTLLWGVTGFIYLLLLIPGRSHSARSETQRADTAAIRQVQDLPALLNAGRAALPGGEITSFRFVTTANGKVLLTARTLHRERWFWEKVGSVTLDARTREVRSLRKPGTGIPRERLLAIMAALHFGSQGGRAQQVLWTLGGMVMLFLPLSGYALWLWRRSARRSHPNICNHSQQPVVINQTAGT